MCSNNEQEESLMFSAALERPTWSAVDVPLACYANAAKKKNAQQCYSDNNSQCFRWQLWFCQLYTQLSKKETKVLNSEEAEGKNQRC